jgi:hypothetical protein
MKSWGGKRKGAGRPQAAQKRQVVSYRLDPDVVELLTTFCFYLRTPVTATMEYALKHWLEEHHEQMMDAYHEFMADKPAFMKCPVLNANLETLKQKDKVRYVREGMDQFIKGMRAVQPPSPDTERHGKLKALVGSACGFLITNQNKDPRTATPQEILDVLGIHDRCTVAEIAEAFAELSAEGHIDRIIRENRTNVR